MFGGELGGCGILNLKKQWVLLEVGKRRVKFEDGEREKGIRLVWIVKHLSTHLLVLKVILMSIMPYPLVF